MANIERQEYDKYQLIDNLAKAGYDTDNADEFLKANGYGPMSAMDRNIFRASQIAAYTPRNAKEIFSGIPTFLGWLAKAGIPAIKRRVPTYLQGGIQFSAGQEPSKEIKEQIASDRERFGPRAIWDTLFSEFNLGSRRIENALSGSDEPGVSLNALGQGARLHPIDFALTAAPLSNPILKALGETKVGSEIVKANKFNKALNQAIVEASASTNKLDKMSKDFARGFHGLSPEEKIAVTEAITLTGNRDLGTKKLNKIAKQGRVLGKSISREYNKSGLIPKDVNAKNIIANNLGNSLDWGGGKLTHQEIMRWLDNPEIMPKEAKELLPGIQELQRRGDITFLSQMLNPAENTYGIPIEKAPSYSKQARVIGTRTPAELAELVPESFDATIRRLSGYKTADRAINKIPEALGVLKGSELEKALEAGTANLYDYNSLLSKTAQAATSGSSPSSILRGLKGATKDTKEAVNIPKEYQQAFSNAVAGGQSHPVLSAWKRSQLITPKWVVENRIGNLFNNAIEGVTGKDYLDALLNQSKMSDLLKQLTSYVGYTGDISGLSTVQGLTEGLKETANALKTIGRGEVGKGLLNLYKGTSNVVSQPIVRLESTLEGLDRYANLIKQGKRLGYSLEDINTNPSKFWEAYENVDKSLGDYTGRQHFLASGANDIINQVVPFWKFPAQTARVTFNQAKDRPLAFQLGVRYPSNLGSDLYERVLEATNQEDKQMEGGYPSGNIDRYGSPKMLRSESIPYTTFAGMLRSLTDPSIGIEEAASNIAPTFNIGNILSGKPFMGRPYTSEKFYTDKYGAQIQKDEQGEIIPEKYEPSFKDYAGYLGAQAFKNWYAPGVFSTRVARPFYKGVVEPIVKDYSFKEATMYPMYDTQINPLSVGNTYAQPKEGPLEIIGPQFGLKSASVFEDMEQPSQITDVGLKGAVKRAFRKYTANQANVPQQPNELREAINNYLKLINQ